MDPAVVVGVSGRNDLGEASRAAVELLLRGGRLYSEATIQRHISPRIGGISDGATFEFWPDQAAKINGEAYKLAARMIREGEAKGRPEF